MEDLEIFIPEKDKSLQEILLQMITTLGPMHINFSLE